MKTEELMLGDWLTFGECVNDKEFPVIRVTGILADTLFAQIYNNTGNDELDAEGLAGIPLTPEILEKNGFSGEGYYMGIIGFHTDPIPEVKDGYEVFIWKDMCLEIKHGFTHLKRYTFYVHELQHALKLCGINLEIKL